jgi:tetratricopeptide (TPR) repeat protein
VASVSELLSIFESTEDLEKAEDALGQIAALERPADLELGECYDGLAEVAADAGDLELAVRAQRRALEYERPDDPWLLSALGAARRGSGDDLGALSALDEALELAKAGSDSALTRRLRAERLECREDQNLLPDEDDRLAACADPDFPDADAYAVAWYPRDQIAAALERWPSLAADLEDPDAYCRIIEARLREVRSATGRVPSVAPLEVDAVAQFASEQGLDPDSGSARSRFAAVLGSRGEAVPWPPGRNEPCWCGSRRKYKRCCG